MRIAQEIHDLIDSSRLKELPGHPMTAKELGLDHRAIRFLRYRGVIRLDRWVSVPKNRNGKPNGHDAVRVWCIGPCWTRFAQKRGWMQEARRG